MYYIFGQVGYSARGVDVLMNYPAMYTSLTFATVFTVVAIPFLLWFRAARWYATAMVLAIQLCIVLFFTLPVFPLFTIVSTLLFFDEDELRGRRRRSTLPASASQEPAASTLPASRGWPRLAA